MQVRITSGSSASPPCSSTSLSECKALSRLSSFQPDFAPFDFLCGVDSAAASASWVQFRGREMTDRSDHLVACSRPGNTITNLSSWGSCLKMEEEKEDEVEVEVGESAGRWAAVFAFVLLEAGRVWKSESAFVEELEAEDVKTCASGASLLCGWR